MGHYPTGMLQAILIIILEKKFSNVSQPNCLSHVGCSSIRWLITKKESKEVSKMMQQKEKADKIE